MEFQKLPGRNKFPPDRCGRVSSPLDYADIKKAVLPIIDQLDHKHLNDIEDLELTSTEYICAWLWRHIKPNLPILTKITIHDDAPGPSPRGYELYPRRFDLNAFNKANAAKD